MRGADQIDALAGAEDSRPDSAVRMVPTASAAIMTRSPAPDGVSDRIT